ncbi:MAG: hypothetical protein ACREIQ_08020 [Nitrospiria bacterium]
MRIPKAESRVTINIMLSLHRSCQCGLNRRWEQGLVKIDRHTTGALDFSFEKLGKEFDLVVR